MNKSINISKKNIEVIARTIGDMHNDISKSFITLTFKLLNITDNSEHDTKWKRLCDVFLSCYSDNREDKVIEFIEACFAPSRYANKNSEFEEARIKLNKILLHDGLMLRENGIIDQYSKAETITEADTRAKNLSSKLHERNIHPEVLKFCNAELLHNNYFHAVFEATKCLAQKIRAMSGLKLDGIILVEKAFSSTPPLIALSLLETDSEKSEHRGFANLLKGCFGIIRNPLAHEPRSLWENNDNDAADYLTFISMLYKRLDKATITQNQDHPF